MVRGKKVLVGLSGGVDSAVAAMLLVEQGYDVTGVTMTVYGGETEASTAPSGKNACYGPDEHADIALASRAAAILGIPHHVVDCVDGYARHVLDHFTSAWLAGCTPNPCVRCNQLVKFGLLPAMAREQGIEWDVFATGHCPYMQPARHPAPTSVACR